MFSAGFVDLFAVFISKPDVSNYNTCPDFKGIK